MRLLVLGAGFGGLELTTRLSEEHGDDVEIVLIDQSDAFVHPPTRASPRLSRLTTPNAHPRQHEQRQDDEYGDDDRPHTRRLDHPRVRRATSTCADTSDGG
jgi:sulfide:quinone oxidoreductase